MSKLDSVKKATRLSRFIPGSVTRKVGQSVLATRSSSPTILFAAGVIGVVATTVVACRATLKMDEVLKEDRITLAQVKSFDLRSNYTEQDHIKDLTLVYTKMAVKVTKLYGPSLLLGVVSVACLTQSHKILNNRITGLSAAYAALEKGFEEYRQRVVEKYGEDADKELRYAAQERTIVEDTENGPKKVITKSATRSGESIFAKVFDEYNDNWCNQSWMNVGFLKMKQSQFNDTLHTRGWIFLNEVYKELGFDQTEAGQVVGWWYDKDQPEGDNYVSLGVFGPATVEGDKLISLMQGNEGIMLDFNVDGPIHKKLGRNRGN